MSPIIICFAVQILLRNFSCPQFSPNNKKKRRQFKTNFLSYKIFMTAILICYYKALTVRLDIENYYLIVFEMSFLGFFGKENKL